MNTLRALAREWGEQAEVLLRNPVKRTRARTAYNDAVVTTLRDCEKQLVDALTDITAAEREAREP